MCFMSTCETLAGFKEMNCLIKVMVKRRGIYRISEVFGILLVVCVGARGVDEEQEEINFNDLAPKNYDYLKPPTTNGTPVSVSIGVENLNVRSVDESDMSFTVAVELWQVWVDNRLVYPKWARKDSYQVLDSSWFTRLWNPNVYFPNAVDGKVNSIITPSSLLWMQVEGGDNTMIFCSRLVLKLICEMDLVNFPHDEQRCGLKIASAMYPDQLVVMEFLNYTSDDPVLKLSVGLQQFEVVGREENTCLLKMGLDNVSCLETTVVLRRRSGYYLINVYIPTVLIVIMSMLTFWIPADAVPARITLGVTSLLTIITKQYQAAMPSVSYIVGLNVWLSCCIAFVFLSLLEYATVIAMGTKKAQSQQKPDLTFPVVLLKANGTWITKKCWTNVEEKINKSNRLDLLSKIFFPIFFAIFVISYWRYYS